MTIAFASNLAVGDPIGPPTATSLTGSQTITEIKRASQGRRVLVTTNLGLEYDFNWNERVMLPRRPDGSTVDWRTREEPPTPAQIFCGDILPHPTEVRPENPYSEKIWLQTMQRVTGIYRTAPGSTMICIIAYQEPTGGVRRWYVDEKMPVTFPRKESRTIGEMEDRPEMSGVYVDRSNDQIKYRFLVHPAGAGRWPAGTPEFVFKIEPGLYHTRPPGHRSAWRRLDFIDNPARPDRRRHPRDPQWTRS